MHGVEEHESRIAPGATDPAAGETDAPPARVWGATAVMGVGRVWAAACGLIVLALLARGLSGPEFGRLTFYVALFTFLESLVDFGTSSAVLQRGASDPWALTANLLAGRRIRVLCAALSFLAAAAVVFLLGESDKTWVLLAALLPFSRVLELSGLVFRNRIAWGVPVAIQSAGAAARLGLVVVLWRFGVTTFGPYLLVHVAGGALTNVALFLAARRHLPRPSIPIVPARGLIRAAFPIALAGMCQQAYFYVDNLFVRAIAGDVAVGQYNACVRILTVGVWVAVFSTSAALPWLARCWHTRSVLRPALRLAAPLAIFGTILAGLLGAFAEEVLTLVFGPSFDVAAPSLRWLAVALALIYAGSSLLTAVVASGRQWAFLAVAASALAVNCVCNAWLVPALGMEGAAIATALTELVVLAGALVVLLRGVSGGISHASLRSEGACE